MRKPAQLLITTGVLLVALTGCGGGVPAATETPTTSPTARPSPTATATPTPTPTASAEDPSDPGTWIITPTRLGPVEIGTPLADLQSLVPFPLSEHGGSGICVGSGDDPTYPVLIFAHDGSAVIAAIVNVGQPADPFPLLSPHTAEGIRVGSTVAEVEATYPAVAALVGPYETPYYPLEENGLYVNLVINDGVVRAMHTSTVPLIPGEYC